MWAKTRPGERKVRPSSRRTSRGIIKPRGLLSLPQSNESHESWLTTLRTRRRRAKTRLGLVSSRGPSISLLTLRLFLGPQERERERRGEERPRRRRDARRPAPPDPCIPGILSRCTVMLPETKADVFICRSQKSLLPAQETRRLAYSSPFHSKHLCLLFVGKRDPRHKRIAAHRYPPQL